MLSFFKQFMEYIKMAFQEHKNLSERFVKSVGFI